MLLLLSPAKSMRNILPFSRETPHGSKPKFLDKSQSIVDLLKTLSKSDLKTLYGVSPSLAEINYERIQSFQQGFNEGS